ncbi:MAG TPA: hypothetical protein VMM82_09615 [Spirochaetia bacterium]|nr:hypothetical protein [Spirochaetia bacterium]
MPRDELAGDGFESRRRKEELAFLVVKFLKAFLRFREIREVFRSAAESKRLADSGLFERVRDLEEGLAYDLKEKAHYLFRAQANSLAAEARSIDSYVGTGYHVLLILRESLYQVEHYAPEIADRADSEKQLYTDTEVLAGRMVERCDELFTDAAKALRHFMTAAEDNEILVLNLLQNIELLEHVYGANAAEEIFCDLCKGKRVAGRTGMERALSLVKAKCGNVTGLPAQPA